jgi:DNA-binding NarL/FixJ family response regulator
VSLLSWVGCTKVVSSILAKLDLNNRVQIALLVHDAGLLDDHD